MGYKLILDTSSKYIVVGLANEDKVIDCVQYEAWQRQSEVAMQEIEKILNKNKVDTEEIDCIIVSKGPGSYTGIRIALTIAKVFALVKKVSIITLSSLEVFVEPKGKFISLLDARSKRAYMGVYEDGKQVQNEGVFEIEEIKDFINNHKDFTIVGEVKVLGLEEKEQNLAANMFEMAKGKEIVSDVDSLVPTYLKDTYAN